MAQHRATEPGKQRRAALVRAGYEQLAQRGFEGLRTRDVAAAVGVNVATLHYYFPTKEALIGGILEEAMRRFSSTITRSASRGDLLRAHFRGLRRLVREEPELFAVMGELALRSTRDPAIAQLFNKTVEIWQHAMRTLIAQAIRDGSIDSRRDPDDQAALIVSGVMGASMLPINRPTRLARTFRELEQTVGLSRPGRPTG